MNFDKSVPCSPLPLCLFSGEAPRLSGRPALRRPSDEGSQMGDEGCSNEDPSSDDATGYSEGEEEAFAEATLPDVPEPISSR